MRAYVRPVMRKIQLAILAVSLSIIPAAPAFAYERLPSALAKLSPSDFAGKVRIVDDPLEPAIVLSTQDGYTRGRSIKGAQANDVHLRALVDRETGQVSWQVWHQLSYVGQQRNLESVHYLAGGALKQSGVMAVEHWLDQCPPTDGIGSCNQFTKVGFELPDRTIREIAGAYRAGQQTPWRLRFKDRDGRDITGGLAPAEAAGLLHALETWRRTAS